MIDIVSNETGKDIGLYDTQAPKAGNILSIQVGSLEYAQDLGIDLAYFLDEKLKYQNDSFVSYLVETLANRGVNVAEITKNNQTLFMDLILSVSPDETSTALVDR